MTKRIVFATNKGGQGKTTSTVAVAEILAEAGYRVLVVDTDPQGNATRMISQKSIYDFTGKTIMEAIQNGDAAPYIVNINDNMDLIPAEDRAAMLSRYIYTSRINNPYAALKRTLKPIEHNYDYVFVDVGPTLGDAQLNAIVYVDHIIVPIDGGDFATDALIRFMDFVDTTRAEGHTNAQVSGILLTLRDRRSKYEKDVADGIRATFGDLVFATEIGRKVKIKEMAATGVDVSDPAMAEYIALVEEIVGRTGGDGNEQKYK